LEVDAVAVLGTPRDGEPLADPHLDLIHVRAREHGRWITTRRLVLALAPLVVLFALFTAAIMTLFL
jgi:hypothetical protein